MQKIGIMHKSLLFIINLLQLKVGCQYWFFFSLLTSTWNSVNCVDVLVVKDIEYANIADIIIERSFDGSQGNKSSKCLNAFERR